MRRLAIFVEGRTEVLLLDRLLTEIAGVHNVVIEHREIIGGTKVQREVRTLRAAQSVTDQKYYVLIVDCRGDHQVKSRILEEHFNLTKAGYTKIIGIRDVRPDFVAADIPRLQANLNKYVKTSLAPVEFILAVMEIEAWFLAETNHFSKVHPAITIESIKNTLGFDPAIDDMALRIAPAEDLANVYRIGGKSYKKPWEETIEELDYGHLYVDVAQKIAELKSLVSSLDAFLG